MDFLYGVLIFVEVIVSIVMIIAILLQPSDEGLGVAFGGGSSQALFGGRGATTFLSKLTGILGAVFFILSIIIAMLTGSSKSVVDQVTKEQPVQQQTLPSGESQKEQPKTKESK